MQAVKLDHRTLLRLSGPDTRELLQGIITNDMDTLSPGGTLYAALLTPQGKFLFDMILLERDSTLYLECDRNTKDELLRRLMMYKLRADVTIEDISADWHVYAATGEIGDICAQDPRASALGYRVYTQTVLSAAVWDDYERIRLINGVPDGNRDMAREKHFWLETDAERLNGVSFTKGCYVGQELTARMKHRTTLKKKIVPVSADVPLDTGADIVTGSGKKAGTVLSTNGTYALAYMRLEYATESLSSEETTRVSIVSPQH